MRLKHSGRRRGAVAAGLLVLMGIGVGRPAGQAHRTDVFWKDLPDRFALTTGVPCIYQRAPASPMTVFGIFVAGGRSAVPPGLDGLASLVTRLTLEIPDEGKVQDLMAQASQMSFDCLEDCSLILIECLSGNLEEALRVGAKIIQDPLISGLRVGRAKEVMKIYRRVEEDDAATAAHNEIMKAFFAGLGYGTSLYGTEASLKAIERKDALAFYTRSFTKKNLFFCVETDLEKETVKRLLEKYFGGFEAGDAIAPAADRPVEPAERDIVLKKDTHQVYIGRAYVLPPPDRSGQAKGYLVETLLGKGPGSRLWGLRADDRLAYTVDADLTWTRTAGILTAYLETSPAKKDAAVAALDKKLADLCEQGITEEELATARTMAKARFLRMAESKPSRLRTLGLFEVLGLGIDSFSGFFQAIDAVTPEELSAFVREALAPERALRVSIGPAEP
jgi:zinc protease